MNTFNMIFSASLKNEVLIRAFVHNYLKNLNVNDDTLIETKTIVSEAICNAIIHGYNENDIYNVELYLELVDRTLTITVIDEGVGIENIDLALTPLYTSKSDKERSGLGFTIMESFSDRLEVYSSKDHGTRITMTKVLK